jgi:hypothetical protein
LKRLRIAQFGGDALGEGGVEAAGPLDAGH